MILWGHCICIDKQLCLANRRVTLAVVDKVQRSITSLVLPQRSSLRWIEARYCVYMIDGIPLWTLLRGLILSDAFWCHQILTDNSFGSQFRLLLLLHSSSPFPSPYPQSLIIKMTALDHKAYLLIHPIILFCRFPLNIIGGGRWTLVK